VYGRLPETHANDGASSFCIDVLIHTYSDGRSDYQISLTKRILQLYNYFCDGNATSPLFRITLAKYALFSVNCPQNLLD
jgi:hypothetical protein